MTTLLKEQAWQSGLVLSDETAEWNQNDWPPLVGGWRAGHTSVVLDHPDTDGNDNNNNNKRQTVVVLGGYQTVQGALDSILVLNLAESTKQWREGPRMNQKRSGHATVVCNGGVYVMGGYNGSSVLDCIERIDEKDLLLSPLTTNIITHASNWTTFTCRLSTQRWGCCAVAVHNRYIVTMGGYNGRNLSSVDIIDTNNHTVIEGPSMTVPRQSCASGIVGHRIFVVGGHNDNGHHDSVEYLDYATPCDNDATKKEKGSTFISFSSAWITQSELRLSNAQSSCAMVAVGSCLVVAGGQGHSTVEVLDMRRNRVWNLLPLDNHRDDCSTVTVANQVVVISGWGSRTCATLPLLDKHTWCFRRLYKQQIDRWCLFREGRNIQHADNSPFPTWTSDRKRARPHTHRGDEGKDGT